MSNQCKFGRNPRITVKPYRGLADNWGPPGYYCIDGVDINLDAKFLDSDTASFDTPGTWLRDLDDDALDAIRDSYIRKEEENQRLKEKQALYEERVVNESSSML